VDLPSTTIIVITITESITNRLKLIDDDNDHEWYYIRLDVTKRKVYTFLLFN